MPDFAILPPEQQRKILLELVQHFCPGAIWEGDTLHYTRCALHVDLEFGRTSSHNDQYSAQILFILRHDWFDEDLVESCASSGSSLENAMKACAEEFAQGVLQSVLTSLEHSGMETLTAEIIHRKYVFHCPDNPIILHKGKTPPVDLFGVVRNKLPEYLGTKKVYWVKLFSADLGNSQICEARINGTLYPDLTDCLYEEIFSRKTHEISIDKTFFLFIQDESTFKPCPFSKQDVGDLTFLALDQLMSIKDEVSRQKAFQEIHKLAPDYSIAVELTCFIPEIAAQLIVNFRDNDSLIPVFNYGSPEFTLKKSQVRSFGYIADAVEQFFRKYRPSQEELDALLRISSKFETISRALQDKNVKIENLRLSQLVYFVNQQYQVW